MPSTSLAESDTVLVPEPWVHETHVYGVAGDGKPSVGHFTNEWWSLEIKHGDVMTLLLARNMTQDNETGVDYTFNVHYYIGGTLYIAQFMMMYTTFVIEDQRIDAPFSTCDGFKLDFTPTQYVGSTPTLWCNITYEGIDIYPDSGSSSSFDLTLCHYITADWNQTDIKVEALVDLSNVELIDPTNDLEFADGEPYAVEIHYAMRVGKANSNEGALTPTGHTDSSIQYDLVLDSGAPLSISKMEMEDAFTVYNASDSYGATAYSSIGFGVISEATHGFPGLVYGDTLSIKSDPEVTVFHDRVTTNQNNNPGSLPFGFLAVIAAAAVVAIAALVLVRKRRKK